MQENLYVFTPSANALVGLDYQDLKTKFNEIYLITFDKKLVSTKSFQVIHIPLKYHVLYAKDFWIRDYIFQSFNQLYRAGFKTDKKSFYPPLLTKVFDFKLENSPVTMDGGEVIVIDDLTLTSNLDYYNHVKNQINIEYIELDKKFSYFYHLDLVVSPLSKDKVLLSNPFILNYYQNKNFEHKTQMIAEIERIRQRLINIGFKNVIDFPVVLKENKEGMIEIDNKAKDCITPLNALVNGLHTESHFYYSWMDIRIKSLQDELDQFLRLFKEKNLRRVELRDRLYDKLGGLRCLSSEVKIIKE